MLNEAIELLFDLEEWEHATDTLAEIAPRLLQQGQARGLTEWIDRLPIEAQQRSPHLQVWRARASLKLRDLDEALRRIDDGTYGFCEETGEPIGVARLEARPIATLSLEAQERHERRERVHRDD